MVLYLSNNGIKFEVTTMFYLPLLWYIYLFVIENTKNGWWNWVLKPSISLVMYQANLLSFDLIILSFSLNMFLLKMPKNCWVNFGAFQHSLDGWNPWLYAENGRVGIIFPLLKLQENWIILEIDKIIFICWKCYLR